MQILMSHCKNGNGVTPRQAMKQVIFHALDRPKANSQAGWLVCARVFHCYEFVFVAAGGGVAGVTPASGVLDEPPPKTKAPPRKRARKNAASTGANAAATGAAAPAATGGGSKKSKAAAAAATANSISVPMQPIVAPMATQPPFALNSAAFNGTMPHQHEVLVVSEVNVSRLINWASRMDALCKMS